MKWFHFNYIITFLNFPDAYEMFVPFNRILKCVNSFPLQPTMAWSFC